VAIFVFHVSFPLIVLAAGGIGFFRARRWPQTAAPADDTDHGLGESPTAARALRIVAVWGALWAVPVLAIAAIGGWDGVYAQVALFFSWLAVVTFGGAYAVLAYVAEAAVFTFAWLSPSEMLDGLALAETTPGPLILVLSYVGYLAAFRSATGLDPVLAGLLGGLLTAWVTFVPCFLWIFLGAPHVERLRGNPRLSGALSAITAAVVGVILNLAVWLGLHVLFGDVGALDWGPIRPAWPEWATVDSWAVALLVVAVVSLVRLRLGVPATLAICAVLGVAIRLV
jgi:chromate transporter